MVLGWQWGSGAGGPGSRLSSAARGTAGVAATVLGLRVSRAATLRVSALLAFRSLLAPIQLPLDAGVGALLWSGAFAAAQTAALAAAFADRLQLPGVLGRWGASLFSPVDAPFVALYSVVVLVFGPLIAVFESIVAVYEVVRVTRLVEDRINSSVDVREESMWQRVNLALAIVSLSLVASLVVFLPVYEVTSVALALCALLILLSLFSLAGNILHAGLLSLYVTFILIEAVAEQIDLFPGFGAGERPQLHSPEARAFLLIFSSAMTLVGLARLPVFVRVVLSGADTVFQERQHFSDSQHPIERGALNCLAVISLTFRFLVFHRDIQPGEYYPLFCRGLQTLVAVMLYVLFMRIEGAEGGNHEPIQNGGGN